MIRSSNVPSVSIIFVGWILIFCCWFSIAMLNYHRVNIKQYDLTNNHWWFILYKNDDLTSRKRVSTKKQMWFGHLHWGVCVFKLFKQGYDHIMGIYLGNKWMYIYIYVCKESNGRFMGTKWELHTHIYIANIKEIYRGNNGAMWPNIWIQNIHM